MQCVCICLAWCFDRLSVLRLFSRAILQLKKKYPDLRWFWLILGGQEIRGKKTWVYNGRTFIVRDCYRWFTINFTFYSPQSLLGSKLTRRLLAPGHLAGWPNLAKNYNNLVFAFPTPINKIIIYPVLQALVFRGFSSNFIILMGNLSLSLINFTFQISVQFIPSSIITIALMPFFLHLLAGLLQ